MAADKIVYRLTTPEDYNSVLEFLREHYYPEEPLTISSEPKKQDIYDEEANTSHVRVANDHATCFVAVCAEQIVGALIAGAKDVDEEHKLLEEASHIPDTKWAKILIFLASLERDSNIYEKYKVKRAIHCHELSVHKNFRGKGIGLKLIEKSMERSKELGYPLYTTDCTSVYSARLCERLNMDCVNECSLADYRSPGNGKQVFFPGKHTSNIVRTFAKRL